MKRGERPIEEVIKQAFSNAYPNPQRIDCPGINVLKALAERRNPGSPELTEHMSHCSPCTLEFLQVKSVWDRRQTQRRLAVAAMGLLATAAVFLWLFLPSVTRRRSPSSGDNPAALLIVAVLDYHEAKLRGLEHPSLQTIPVKTNELRIVIARGSETGIYVVAIQRPAHVGEDLATFSGEALAGVDGFVVLRAKVDLSRFPAGEYVAVWRHGGAENYGSFFISR